MPTREEIGQFFGDKQKGVYKCPICQSTIFALNTDAAPNDTRPSELHVPSVNGGAHPFFSISCTNCGFTSFFHLNQFNSWKKAKTDPHK